MEALNPTYTEILMFLVLLVIWLALPLLPAHYARKKGYNYRLGYVGGLIAWLPTVIVVALAKPTTEATPAQLRLGNQKICPLCTSSNNPTAVTCAECGMAFAASVRATTAVETMHLSDELRIEVNEGRVRLCQNCGRLNNPKRATCKSCGGEFAV